MQFSASIIFGLTAASISATLMDSKCMSNEFSDGYVNFVPGTVMTVVSALAIVLSFTAYFKKRE
ncbi:exported hypothetical protein [Vibrio nigripulchritudo SO65]|nr:exported hypothetical protein [Vibrio nigripulchritudo AM115]CCN40748.1 exported hypothetical protein [Vibrio nigripulchritudo FTn2]CCN64443.1 exported hypothetical protein [Vibrio nigripulchritudo POn4]CCN77448.1 exported hypothetical protein [Vibrio nigripulchritudo SO65]